MATVAAVIASTHHPFYYRASTSTGADRPPFADEWVAKIQAFRETLTRSDELTDRGVDVRAEGLSSGVAVEHRRKDAQRQRSRHEQRRLRQRAKDHVAELHGKRRALRQ
ncbi:MAG TPA: hypothetical protein VHT94_12890, partial [Streptosporangiaceae bacterium]|nr:hypothetical protein [Streptosporangiaceae bacterium]